MIGYRYTTFDLTIESALELPELRSADFEQSDIQIQWGVVERGLNHVDAEGILFQRNVREFLLRLAGIANYLARDGSSITIERAYDIDDDSIRLFLIESVLPVVLAQRGLMVLNGSVVQTPFGAVGFLGQHVAGKSVIAAALNQRGYALVSDGICVAKRDETGQIVMLPGFPEIRLWEDALPKLGLSARKRVRPELEKCQVDAARFCANPVPLYALYSFKEASEFQCVPLGGLEKFNALAATVPGQLIPHVSPLQLLLAQNKPMFSLGYPHQWEAVQQVVDYLEASWRS